MEDGIYIPREHFQQLLAEVDELIRMVDQIGKIVPAVGRCRPALIAAKRRIEENDPDKTPVRSSLVPIR